MVQAGLAAALRDGEIDARIVEHPFRVVGFGDRGFGGEHAGVKADAVGQVVDRDMDVQAFHEDAPSGVLQAGERAGVQGLPPQQLSVRKETRPFMVAKSAV
ncbi:hypothetical protein D9M68_981790 [compost metagenome]